MAPPGVTLSSNVAMVQYDTGWLLKMTYFVIGTPNSHEQADIFYIRSMVHKKLFGKEMVFSTLVVVSTGPFHSLVHSKANGPY